MYWPFLVAVKAYNPLADKCKGVCGHMMQNSPGRQMEFAGAEAADMGS